MRRMIFLIAVAALLTACVSKKKYLEAQGQYKDMQTSYAALEASCDDYAARLRQMENQLLTCETSLKHASNQVKSYDSELQYFKETNTNMLDRLADLSVVSKAGAESIKKSLEALNSQNKYIQDLTTTMRQKDSLNLVLVMNLKRSLSDVNDDDVTVEVKKGVVYISLSDKMLFTSGSYQIQPAADVVLGKIAKVLNDHKHLDILVEGHTDNVPYRSDCLVDNWDLSVKRSTAVVRTLQTKYNVKPERMTAGGRGEYVPKAENTTAANKSMNRRTEIIILPKLDEFFQLLDPPASVDAGATPNK